MNENTLMVYVAWSDSRGPDRTAFLKRWLSADMGDPVPDPPLSDAEMQPVVFAAKMALAKVLRGRKDTK
jgi:hypothetical protein